jgi:hypothetical protein
VFQKDVDQTVNFTLSGGLPDSNINIEVDNDAKAHFNILHEESTWKLLIKANTEAGDYPIKLTILQTHPNYNELIEVRYLNYTVKVSPDLFYISDLAPDTYDPNGDQSIPISIEGPDYESVVFNIADGPMPPSG